MHNRLIPSPGVLLLMACCLIWVGPAQAVPQRTLVEKGVLHVRLQSLGKNPTLDFAAQEWHDIFSQLIGRDAQPADSSWTLQIGLAGQSAACDAALTANGLTRQKLTGDGFLIVEQDNGLLLTAYTGRGVLYGMYRLIEQSTGFRWTRPWIDSHPIKSITRAMVNLPLPYTDQPAFSWRGQSVSAQEWWRNSTPMSYLKWMMRNGYNIKNANVKSAPKESPSRQLLGMRNIIAGHSFEYYIPPTQENFAKHPDFFPLIDGKRVATDHVQLCFSNPKVVEAIAQKMEQMVKKDLTIEVLALGFNDGQGWCQCDNCVKMDSPKDTLPAGTPGVRNYSTRYIRFANAIARRVTAVYPKIKIQVYAYSWSALRPPDCEVDPALVIEFCPLYRCLIHAINDPDCPRNRMFCKWLEGWRAKTRNIYIRDYYCLAPTTGSSLTFSPYSIYTVREEMQYYKHLGLLGVDPEVFPDGPNGGNVYGGQPYGSWLLGPQAYQTYWDSTQLLHFALGRLAWHPDESVEKIVRAFCRSYYGPAAEPMSQYHLLLNKNWRDSGRPGRSPQPEEIKNWHHWVFAGPDCYCWSWLKRAKEIAGHLFNTSQGKAEEHVLAAAKLLQQANRIAKQSKHGELRRRIEREFLLFNHNALGLGMEMNWRKNPVIFAGDD